MHHHAWLIFIILVEMGFNHVGQAGLELLTSSDLPVSVSQNAGITGMRHHVWLLYLKDPTSLKIASRQAGEAGKKGHIGFASAL